MGLTQGDGSVDPFHAVLVTGRVAGSVDQVEHFIGVRQTYDQRRVAPDSFVGHVHPPFAFPQGPSDRSVHIDVGLVQESFGLLQPDPLARAVDALLQRQNVGRFKAPGEVSGRGWIGTPLRPQAVEIVFVLTAQFQVLQPNPTGQDVVGEVPDGITFMIGQMDLADRKSTRLNSSHVVTSRMPSSA